jgi:hypothetical protein
MTDAAEYREQADALESLADDLKGADSIAEDVPVLSELFHEVRTGGRSSRDGRYVALLDRDGDKWECQSVAFLESGTHYRDTGADAKLSFAPYPFLSVDTFADAIASDLRRSAKSARQNAANVEQAKLDAEARRKYMGGRDR